MSKHNLDYKIVKNKEITQIMGALRNAFIFVEDVMQTHLPQSREAALAYTNLEQALMWAIKSLVILPEASLESPEVEI